MAEFRDKRHFNKGVPRKLSEIQEKEIASFYSKEGKEHKSSVELSLIYKVNHKTILSALRRQGIEILSPEWPEENYC